MDGQTDIRLQATAEIVVPDGLLFEEIFPSGSGDPAQELASVLTPQAASAMLPQLADVEGILGAVDTHEAVAERLQMLIDAAEGMRDQLLAQIFEKLRPIERSYRLASLFFENARPFNGESRKRVELHVFNADSVAMRRPVESQNVAAIKRFIQMRNDNFSFHDDIPCLVLSGYLRHGVREKLEDLANSLGILLIGDTDDEASFSNLERQCSYQGEYEFTRRLEDGAAVVMLANYLLLRPAHSFEAAQEGDDLYGPPSLVFAGALLRTEPSNGNAAAQADPLFGQITGVGGSRFDVRSGDMESLSVAGQLICVIRDDSDRLCFCGCRSLSDDSSYRALDFLRSYRVVRYIERVCEYYLQQAAGFVLTREFIEESIETPLWRFLNGQVEQETLLAFKLYIDRGMDKRLQGACDIHIEVTPAVSTETFVLYLNSPEFKRYVPEGRW